MPLQTNGMVIKNDRIKSPYFILGIHCPSIADQIKPGQFIMLKVSDNHSPFLRRPFSVYKTFPTHSEEKKNRGELFILYKKVGKGTQKMTTFKKGQTINLVGPLGKGFTPPPLSPSARCILIGGGVGIVSLSPLAQVLRDRTLFVFIGGKTREDILCVEDFKKFTPHISIATEDGSLGFKGTVVDLFISQKKLFNQKAYLYSSGPMGMLKALARNLNFKNTICQVSLETRMGCGFGACWGCVVKTNHPQTPYQRICKEGPVFNLENILWE